MAASRLGRVRSLPRRVARRVARIGQSRKRQNDPWFWDHYEQAAGQVVSFLAEEGLSMSGADVADIGCGDGIIDLGVFHRANPRKLVGFDLRATNEDHLLTVARTNLGRVEIPDGLEFRASGPTEIPAPDDSFDFVMTWSAFEHIGQPEDVLREMHRILRPEGFLFLQLWPFFNSQHGSHLDAWYPNGFVQFEKTPDEIREDVLRREPNANRANYMLEEYDHLNRITVDDLGHALQKADFEVFRLQLLTHTIQVPPAARTVDLSALGIAGVVLLARPRG